MAKLTRRQTEQLQSVLGDLAAAMEYVSSPTTVVCKACDAPTTTLHYTPHPNRPASEPGAAGALYPVAKEYGSDLCRMVTAQKRLAAFMAQHSQPA